MRKLHQALTTYLREKGLSFREIGEMPILEVTYPMQACNYKCQAIPAEERNQLVFYTFCPLKAHTTRRLSVSEFITRANSELMIGNLEMNYEDGEIRFKTCIDLASSDLTPVLIDPVVEGSVRTMEFFLPKLMLVMYANVPPALAAAQAKASATGPDA